MENRYYKNTTASKIFDVFNYIFLGCFTVVVIYPLWQQLAMSLNDVAKTPMGQLGFWPKHITFDAYTTIFKDTSLIRASFISVLRVLVGTTSTLFCTGLLAYVTTIRRFRGRGFLRKVFVFTMYFSGGLIPTYLLFVNLKLTNTFWVYIIPGLFSAYYMLLISSYIQGIPEALFEAARIDGCSEMGIYLKIVLPVCVPVFAAIAVYLAVGHWNSWFDVMIYNPKGQWDTLQVILRRILLEADSFAKIVAMSGGESKFATMTSESLRSATTVIVTMPILLVYPFFQKYFISGITIGSVK